MDSPATKPPPRRLLPLLVLGTLVVVLLQSGGGGGGPSPASLRPATLASSTSSATSSSSASSSSSSSSSSAAAVSFNVIITTAGRDTLARMLASIAPQLEAADHLTVISDKGHEEVAAAVAAVRCRCTVRHIANPKPLGFWGHGSRSHWQNELPGDYHMNADDDDVYDPQAMEMVRAAVGGRLEPPTLFVFHMIRRWDGVVELIPPAGWTKVQVKYIGTPCGVYRKIPDLPGWHGNYGGDGGFYTALAERMEKVVFVPQVFYQVGQGEDLLQVKDALLAPAGG